MRAGLLTSSHNPHIKKAMRLYQKRERDETGLFLIEGYREVLRAVQGGVVFEEVFIAPSFFLGEGENRLIDQIEAPVYEVAPHLFQKLSYRDRPDGILAIARQMHKSLASLKGSLFVIAEAIEKPGNLGTILRSTDGVGGNGVIVCDRCTDIYNPNVVRASVGTLFTIPVVETSNEGAFSWLKENGISIIAATPSATVEYTDADLSGPIAIAVGTEQLGLSHFWMRGASLQVSIPMLGVADSLNVATATTLLLYEALRQRR